MFRLRMTSNELNKNFFVKLRFQLSYEKAIFTFDVNIVLNSSDVWKCVKIKFMITTKNTQSNQRYSFSKNRFYCLWSPQRPPASVGVKVPLRFIWISFKPRSKFTGRDSSITFIQRCVWIPSLAPLPGTSIWGSWRFGRNCKKKWS